mmetsp:Transcript_40455/g.126575  ORF Transcript_40455/g.126575 Transcript_40455/m.126575 type:complete len:244 (-) Transcript_40455:271-1002(-)
MSGLEHAPSVDRPEYRAITRRFQDASGRRPVTYTDYGAAFRMEARRLQGQQVLYGDSIETLLRRIKNNPTHAAHYHALSQLLKARGDDARALRALKKAVVLNPSDVFARNDFALHLHDTGDSEGAMKQISIAVRTAPHNPLVRKNAAAIYSRKGRYNEAREHAEAAIRYAPQDPAGYRLLARIRDVQGNTEESLKWGRVAIQLGPGKNFQYEPGDADQYRHVAVQSVGMGEAKKGHAKEHFDQ